MMKRKYMKPAMRKVEIQPRHFLLQSPNDYDGRTIKSYRGGDDDISNEEDII